MPRPLCDPDRPLRYWRAGFAIPSRRQVSAIYSLGDVIYALAYRVSSEKDTSDHEPAQFQHLQTCTAHCIDSNILRTTLRPSPTIPHGETKKIRVRSDPRFLGGWSRHGFQRCPDQPKQLISKMLAVYSGSVGTGSVYRCRRRTGEENLGPKLDVRW